VTESFGLGQRRWAVHVPRMGERRTACRVLVGKPEGMRSGGKPRCRWDNNIKTDLQKKNRMGRGLG